MQMAITKIKTFVCCCSFMIYDAGASMNRIESNCMLMTVKSNVQCRIKSHSFIHSFILQPITVKPNQIIFLVGRCQIKSKYKIKYLFFSQSLTVESILNVSECFVFRSIYFPTTSNQIESQYGIRRFFVCLFFYPSAVESFSCHSPSNDSRIPRSLARRTVNGVMF